MKLILSNEEAIALRLAVEHELNDNSYQQTIARSDELKERVNRERAVLKAVYAKLSEE